MKQLNSVYLFGSVCGFINSVSAVNGNLGMYSLAIESCVMELLGYVCPDIDMSHTPEKNPAMYKLIYVTLLMGM